MNLNNDYRKGFSLATAAYLLWGILPVYWKALQQLEATQILCHRILWSFLFILLLIGVKGRLADLGKVIRDKKNMIALGISSVLITVNWGLYIWAVNSGHIVEASLGYYINPLISILLGLIVLKEKMDKRQGVALVLAAIGVTILSLRVQHFPWVGVLLAVTFGLYGLVKKRVTVNAEAGLAIETMFVAPIALGYLLMSPSQNALLVMGPKITIMLVLAGVVTALPLLFFSRAAQLIPLSTIGFLQYFSPTITLLIGVLLYGEAFTGVHLISFGFIWAAIALYSWSQFSFFQAKRGSTVRGN